MIDGVIDAAEIRRVIAESERPAVRGHQGDLHVGEVDGHRIFVKAATGNPLAASIRRWMLRREYDAYRRLEGIPGIPRCFGFYDGRYLVIEAIDGRSLRDAVIHDRGKFFAQLFRIVDAMHARGVAHGDLMRKDNILVDSTGHPALVDFGASIINRRGFHPLNHVAYRFFAQHDLNAWLKHKYRRRWELVTPEDARYHRRLLFDNLARRIKRAWVALHG